MATDLEMSTVIKGKCVTFNKNLNMSKLLEILDARKLPIKKENILWQQTDLSVKCQRLCTKTKLF